MADSADTVTVGPSGLKALGRPNFIVEAADGTLYLTIAALEYSEAAAGDDAQKKEGVATVRRMFEEGVAQRALRACEVAGPAAREATGLEIDVDAPGVNTEPPGVNTNP